MMDMKSELLIELLEIKVRLYRLLMYTRLDDIEDRTVLLEMSGAIDYAIRLIKSNVVGDGIAFTIKEIEKACKCIIDEAYELLDKQGG